jgi:hypothetical protein
MESEHLLYQDWLLDQFVCVGEPYAVVRDFEVVERRVWERNSAEHFEFQLSSRSHPALSASIVYSGDERLLRKAVSLRNSGDEEVVILDVMVEDLRTDGALSRGGRGQPVLDEEHFFGLEHPAGVNRGGDGRVTVHQLAGRWLAPAETLDCETAVIGLAKHGHSAVEAFREYILALRQRPSQRLRVYSPLGWFDFTNPADPLPELTEQLVDENLDLLEALREDGVAFDIYMLDDWWEPTDLASFRHRTFPSGGAHVEAHVAAAGASMGLWWGTTRSVWTCGEATGIEASVAGGSGLSPERQTIDGAAVEWSWDEEWGALFTREQRLCLAAEPYRTMYHEALVGYVERSGVGLIKCDTCTFHCTSSTHDHLPGKYSVEAMHNAVIAMIEAARASRPELFFVLYWTFRSPWWLRYADTMFDKGLKMELASPSTTPAPIYRQSINLHLDQAAHYARLLPLPLQDSLGLWWGNVALTNRFGKEEWRDAFLLDIARGSALMQCWGDIESLDAGERGFLANVLQWAHEQGSAFLTTTSVGGDPHAAEPYGYAQRTSEGAIVTLYNPSLECRVGRVADLESLGSPSHELVELYPFPGRVAEPVQAESTIDLLPFEVRCLEFVSDEVCSQVPDQQRPYVRTRRPVDDSALTIEKRDRTTLLYGPLVLPEVHRRDRLAFVVRMHRDGVWWNHPDPRQVMSATITLEGFETYAEVAPAVRARTGLGTSWIFWSIPAGPAWSHRAVEVRLQASLPEGVELVTESCLYEQWWLQHERQFASVSSQSLLRSAAIATR